MFSIFFQKLALFENQAIEQEELDERMLIDNQSLEQMKAFELEQKMLFDKHLLEKLELFERNLVNMQAAEKQLALEKNIIGSRSSDPQYSDTNPQLRRNSLVFDGTDYINVANSDNWQLGTSAFTLEMWARISRNSDDFSGLLTMDSPLVSMRISQTGRLQFIQDHGGVRGQIEDGDSSGTNLRDDAWHWHELG